MYARETVGLLCNLPISTLLLSSKLGIFGWQEAYLDISKLSLVGVPATFSPAHVFGGNGARGGRVGGSEGKAGVPMQEKTMKAPDQPGRSQQGGGGLTPPL
jgi:hypothetical protein